MQPLYLSCPRTLYSTETTRIDDTAWPTYVHWLPEVYRGCRSGLVYPPHRLVEKLLDDDLYAALTIDPSQAAQSAFLLAAGNTIFGGALPRKIQPGGQFDYTYKIRAQQMAQIYAGSLAQRLGYSGHIATDGTSCVSASKALMDGIALIRLHGYQRVFILAVEDQISLPMLEFFGETQACLSAAAYDQGQRPSAFDAHHQGFFLGQGAACILLETPSALAQSGHTPIAELLAATVCGEAHTNALGQDPQGRGFIAAIQRALHQAGCTPATIDLIKTHGTGTASNNQAERAALQTVFGNDFIATAYKPWIGHTLGVSSLLELLLAIADARNGLVRGIANRTSSDSNFLHADSARPIQQILSLAAGMGHAYAAVIGRVLSA